ncbi:Epithelial splicing regulatory protein 1 [Taenia crassiceps]|uniref:Epithelial splicing regulatory protein 1 n=1 Tax=Taenia crassiceps TaxID=6207 RepID=A0ABR4QAU0_9CEST
MVLMQNKNRVPSGAVEVHQQGRALPEGLQPEPKMTGGKSESILGCSGMTQQLRNLLLSRTSHHVATNISGTAQMAQKRTIEESIRDLPKVPRLEAPSTEYLLPIEFVGNGTSPCISDIAAALFSLEARKCLFQSLLVIGESKSQQLSKTHFLVASFGEALIKLTQSIENHCPLSAVTMVTKGHRSFRNGLHHEMVHAGVEKSISAQPFWWRYLEIGDFSKGIGVTKAADPVATVELMCEVIRRHVMEGFPLGIPRRINPSYSHASIVEGTKLASGTVVEIHQIPWTATPFSIAVFFRGLNIRPGGIAVKIADGRRSNTVYVAFESELDAKLACDRTTSEDYEVLASLENSPTAQSSRPPNMQIAMASEVLFLQYSVCRIPEVAHFLQQLTDERQIVVRVRGLPYATKKPDIVKFFKEVDAEILNGENGIFFATHADCRPTGDAFVLFVDNTDADRALTRHRNYLGQRYVELFKASPSEAVQVCQSAHQSTTSGANKSVGLGAKLLKPSISAITIKKTASSLSLAATHPPPLPSLPTSIPTPNLSATLALPEISSNLLNPLLFPPSFLSVPLATAFPLTTEFIDPTDPKCPFPRPLPPGGARFVLQIMDLPSAFSRQEMRLFLGAEIYTKVYRMCKITTCLTEGSWLLLMADLVDTLWTVEELLLRTALHPRFLLFEVNIRDLQLSVLPSSRIPPHLPPTRVINLQIAVEAPARSAALQVTGSVGMEPHGTLSSVSPRQPANHLSMGLPLDAFAEVANPCVLRITGLPRNVTQQELVSLYAPVIHLLSSPPHFLPLATTGGEATATYIAIFATHSDAALMLTHCRVCVLRDNTFVVMSAPVGQHLSSAALPSDFASFSRSSKLI